MGRMEKNVKNGIMFQGFEWYLPSGGYFADMENKIPDLVAAGINSVWLPPQCKATGVFDVGGEDDGCPVTRHHAGRDLCLGFEFDVAT